MQYALPEVRHGLNPHRLRAIPNTGVPCRAGSGAQGFRDRDSADGRARMTAIETSSSGSPRPRKACRLAGDRVGDLLGGAYRGELAQERLDPRVAELLARRRRAPRRRRRSAGTAARRLEPPRSRPATSGPALIPSGYAPAPIRCADGAVGAIQQERLRVAGDASRRRSRRARAAGRRSRRTRAGRPVRQRMRFSVANIAGGDGSTSSCVRNAACATAMTRPAAIPCPDASPKRTASRPSGSGTKS